jgi:hypothetical protein
MPQRAKPTLTGKKSELSKNRNSRKFVARKRKRLKKIDLLVFEKAKKLKPLVWKRRTGKEIVLEIERAM